MTVLFVVSKAGYKQAVQLIREKGITALWVNYGVLTQPEVNDLRASGLPVTDFTVDQTGRIDDALDTITEHHPDERIEIVR